MHRSCTVHLLLSTPTGLCCQVLQELGRCGQSRQQDSQTDHLARAVFSAGPSRNMHWITTTGQGEVTDAGRRSDEEHMAGNAVMFDAGKILVCAGGPQFGGSRPATDAAQLITIGEPGEAVCSLVSSSAPLICMIVP